MMEDQYDFSIDLGRYLETLIRQRRFILGAAVLCLVTAILAVFIVPKTYEARALIASVKSESTVSFGSAIQTLSEEALLASGSGAYRILDPEARLNSYVQLIDNPAIAEDVLVEIGDQLPIEYRDVTRLLTMVSGDVVPGSDSIEVVASSNDPEVAALVANAWARAYTQHVNAIYSTGSSPESYTAIQKQTADARVNYEAARDALVEFENINRIDELNRQIDELQRIIDSLSDSNVITVRSVISDVTRVENLIRDAQDMREQVRQGGAEAAASNAMALTLLKAQSFSSHGEATTGLILQTNPGEMTSEGMLRDLDGLVSTLENRQAVLQDDIQVLSEAMVNRRFDESTENNRGDADGEAAQVSQLLASQPDQFIQNLEAELRLLKGRLIDEEGRQRTLVRSQELAWETFNELQTKEAELQVASQTQGSEVALAAFAAVPESDTLSGGRTVLLAAIVGLMLGIGGAYLTEFWWGYKDIELHPIGLRDLFGGRDSSLRSE